MHRRAVPNDFLGVPLCREVFSAAIGENAAFGYALLLPVYRLVYVLLALLCALNPGCCILFGGNFAFGLVVVKDFS